MEDDDDEERGREGISTEIEVEDRTGQSQGGGTACCDGEVRPGQESESRKRRTGIPAGGRNYLRDDEKRPSCFQNWRFLLVKIRQTFKKSFVT